MNCAWNDASQCHKIFNAIKYTNQMINVAFSAHGLHIMSMDGSKTSLIQLELKPAFFKSYTCEHECVFGLHTETLVSVLQKAKGLQLIWKATDDTTLHIVLIQNDQRTQFSIRAIDIDAEELDIPELQDDIKLKMQSDVIRDWSNTLMMTKADATFRINQQEFACVSESVTLGTVKHSEPIGGERVALESYQKDIHITLSFHALKSIQNFAACSSDCWMGFSNEMPTRLHATFADESYLCLYVAPKIQDD